MADVSPPHPIYLRVLAELESQCPTLWKGPIILRLEKIAKRVLIFEIPQIVFLLKKITTVHKTRFVSQNIIRRDCTKG